MSTVCVSVRPWPRRRANGCIEGRARSVRAGASPAAVRLRTCVPVFVCVRARVPCSTAHLAHRERVLQHLRGDAFRTSRRHWPRRQAVEGQLQPTRQVPPLAACAWLQAFCGGVRHLDAQAWLRAGRGRRRRQRRQRRQHRKSNVGGSVLWPRRRQRRHEHRAAPAAPRPACGTRRSRRRARRRVRGTRGRAAAVCARGRGHCLPLSDAAVAGAERANHRARWHVLRARYGPARHPRTRIKTRARAEL